MNHGRFLHRRALDDRTAVVLALAACAGAWFPLAGAARIGCTVVVVALLLARPWLLIVGTALVTSGLAAHATAGLDLEPGVWSGTVEVRRVVTTTTGEVRAEVRAPDRHLELVAPTHLQARVAAADPGDRLDVVGRVTPVDPARSRDRGTHIAGRIHPARVTDGGPPAAHWRLAGTVRDAVVSLARPLSPAHRALFEGFVLGDASGQTSLQRADFRASGLTHLLVASGANVAFVLLLAAPLLTRCGLRLRWALTIGLCATYVLVTGLEPSVLRAATMAVVATTAAGIGRPARSWRTLAYAVALLVVVDPFLVHSTAFGLSVGASAGIIALSRPLLAVLPGPAWLGAPLAVTVAAQLGVAPLLVGFPGGMPVAAVPANLLAAVPAGLVMVAGLPALVLVATGLPGTGVFLWVPWVLLGWVDAVARITASWQLGHLGRVTVLAATVGIGLVLVVGRDGRAPVRWTGWVLAGAGLCAPVLAGPPPPGPPTAGSGPVVVRRSGTVVVVCTGPVPAEKLLGDLAVARVRRIDLVVVPDGDRADAAMLDVIAHRHPVDRVLSPRPMAGVSHPVTVASRGDRVTLGGAVVEVVASEPVLSVHVAARDGP